MVFQVTKTSDYSYKREIKINTLEELLAWCKNTGHEVIIEEDTLEIYDEYRE